MTRWGLAGLGDIATKRVAPAIRAQKDSTLSAVMSPVPAELATFKARFEVAKGYGTFDALVADREVDAVYIATPIALHFGLALQALKAGKHVLVEKPMAMSDAECGQLVAEAAARGVKLGVAYFRRFFPKMKEIRRLLDEDVIGPVVSARVVFHSWYNPSPDDPKYWRVIKAKAGGGPLWDMGCHKLDMLVALLGMPRSVSGRMGTLTHDYEVEDSCTALLELSNGAQATVSFNWNARTWADELVILGTKGKITLDPCDGDGMEVELSPRVIKGMGKEVTSVVLPNATNVHAPLVDDFVTAIQQNRPPLVSGEEGAKTNRILAAIEESSRDGRRVRL